MSFHLYHINEVYSSADGKVQFVELAVGPFNGESFWRGLTLTATQGAITHRFTFPSNLPSTATAGTKVLVATQGFADLGIVQPDFIVPDGFLFMSGGATVDFAGVDSLTYTALPTDGLLSLSAALTTAENSPTNFSGLSGKISSPKIHDVTGSSGDDDLTGTTGADRIDGLDGNDVLAGLDGDDQLIGGTGIDTARLRGARTSYAVGPAASAVTGPDGTDTLSGVERLTFDDISLAFDAGGAAGQTGKLLSAVFGTGFVRDPQYVGIGVSLIDRGMDYLTLAGLALHARLGLTPSDTDVVQLLYTNVVGVAPDAATTLSFVELITGGQFTQVSLTVFAADHPLNLARVDLAGIAEAGIEYQPFLG